MDDRPRSTAARLLAPAALVLGLLAFVLVLATSGVLGGGDDEPAPPKAAEQAKSPETAAESETKTGTQRKREGRLPAGTYTVKTNDTLGDIAQKTGLSVERLQELNPDVDAQQLVSGQKLKLRE